MMFGEIILAVVTGLAVNETCDLAPWAARRMARWAARVINADQPPEIRLEFEDEWEQVILDVPGKLSKLAVAVRYTEGAVFLKCRDAVNRPFQAVSCFFARRFDRDTKSLAGFIGFQLLGVSTYTFMRYGFGEIYPPLATVFAGWLGSDSPQAGLTGAAVANDVAILLAPFAAILLGLVGSMCLLGIRRRH